MTFKEVHEQYDIDLSNFLLYTSIVKAIPKEWKLLIKGKARINHTHCSIYIGKENIDIKEVNTKQLYNFLIVEKINRSKSHNRLSDIYNIDEEEWKCIYCMPRNIQLSNTAKENQYKILHNCIATNQLLYKMKLIESPRCGFCFLYVQSVKHLYWDCLIIKNFWFAVKSWMCNQHDIRITLNPKLIFLGYFEEANFKTINSVILYGKLYISKCK